MPWNKRIRPFRHGSTSGKGYGKIGPSTPAGHTGAKRLIRPLRSIPVVRPGFRIGNGRHHSGVCPGRFFVREGDGRYIGGGALSAPARIRTHGTKVARCLRQKEFFDDIGRRQDIDRQHHHGQYHLGENPGHQQGDDDQQAERLHAREDLRQAGRQQGV